VQLAVAPVQREQLRVRAAFDDLPRFEHQDLVSAADGGQAVCDHERGAARPQAPKAVLDHLLALAVEARRRLVQDENTRVRQDRARDGDALPLAARQLDAAFADHRVVSLRELADELVAVGDAARLLDLGERGAGPGIADVGRDRAVEQEVLLQH
jgi:hypothetical protein